MRLLFQNNKHHSLIPTEAAMDFNTLRAPPGVSNPFQTRENLELMISCTELVNLDLFSKTDPMCVLFLKQFGQWKELGRTEAVRDQLNPKVRQMHSRLTESNCKDLWQTLSYPCSSQKHLCWALTVKSTNSWCFQSMTLTAGKFFIIENVLLFETIWISQLN